MGYNELINECSPHDAMSQPPGNYFDELSMPTSVP